MLGRDLARKHKKNSDAWPGLGKQQSENLMLGQDLALKQHLDNQDAWPGLGKQTPLFEHGNSRNSAGLDAAQKFPMIEHLVGGSLNMPPTRKIKKLNSG